MTSRPSRPEPQAYLLLAVGVLSVGAAAILIREADAPALTISFWRTCIGGAVLAVFVRARGIPFPRGRALTRALVAGVLLGVHFWAWIASLAETSVAASVVLVCTQPVFVAVLASVVLKERTSAVALGGIAVAFAGAALIALDAQGVAGGNALLGDALALVGAVAIAVYVLVGRGAAGTVHVLAYSATVSLVAAAALAVPLLVGVARGVSALPPSASSWGFVVALALGPQLIGHSALNAALTRLPAAVVSGSILGEPIIATALAWAFLHEQPGLQTLAGSAVVLVGLALLLRPSAAAPSRSVHVVDNTDVGSAAAPR